MKSAPPTQIIQSSEKFGIKIMNSAIIKESRQDEQQNQTTITNNNYIQCFDVQFFKKKFI